MLRKVHFTKSISHYQLTYNRITCIFHTTVSPRRTMQTFKQQATGRQPAGMLRRPVTCAVPRICTRRPCLLTFAAALATATTAATVKLYDYPLAFNPAKARLALVEKRVPYDSSVIDLFNGDSLSPEYLRLNPNGTSPTLVDGAEVITESRKIVEHVDARDGQPLGGSGVDRAFIDKWLDQVDAWDGNLFVAIENPAAAGALGKVGEFKRHVAEARLRDTPDLRDVYQARIKAMDKTAAKNSDPAAAAENRRALRALLQTAEERLAGSKYLAGDEYSVADVMFTPVLHRIHTVKKEDTYLTPYPRVSAYYSLLQQRPSFEKVFGPADNPLTAASLMLPAIAKAAWSTVTGRY